MNVSYFINLLKFKQNFKKQKLNPYSEECKNFKSKYKKVLNDLFNENIDKIIVFKEDGEYNSGHIKSVNIENALEIGPNNNAVHSHTLISISHYSLIKLDYGFINQYIKDKMNLKNIFINSFCLLYIGSWNEFITKLERLFKKIIF